MSAADEAYRRAEAKIAKAEGAVPLSFDSKEFRALDRIPPQIAELTGLQSLDLNNTQITDLAPLAGMTGLQTLYLSNTQITDLAPLAGMTGLQHLYLDKTQITDLAPQIAELTGLRSLDLSNTRITDLAQLEGMTGMQTLSLNSTRITDLAPLAGMTGLQTLSISNTRITDLAQLVKMTGMQNLFLYNTQITDLAPLEGMTELQSLYLYDTQITDLAPLAGMTGLGVLVLDRARIADLRPLANLEELGTIAGLGLRFAGTPATKRDKRLAELAQIEDDKERARETLAYLRTLPPWPEPYTPADSPLQPIGGITSETKIPAPKPAPLEVGIIDDKLILKRPAQPLGDDQHSRARQAWAALQYSLDDLVDMRPRIGNQMPALDRALKRLDAALSKEYDASGQIELGILGERIIAQAQAADDTMVPSDAAELKTFAAALAVFLERFPEWKAYRSDDTRPEAAPLPRDLLPAIDAVFEDLIGRPEVDAVIPQKLREQSEDVREEPENRKLIRGFVDSVNNVLGILAEAALKGARVVISEIKDFSGQTWKKVKKIGSTAAALYVAGKVTGLGSAAADFFAKTAVGLRSIAQTNPEEFGWLLKFLTLLGL